MFQTLTDINFINIFNKRIDYINIKSNVDYHDIYESISEVDHDKFCDISINNIFDILFNKKLKTINISNINNNIYFIHYITQQHIYNKYKNNDNEINDNVYKFSCILKKYNNENTSICNNIIDKSIKKIIKVYYNILVCQYDVFNLLKTIKTYKSLEKTTLPKTKIIYNDPKNNNNVYLCKSKKYVLIYSDYMQKYDTLL